MPSSKCPKCGSCNTQRSRRRGLHELLLLRLAGRAPFRCGDCRQRFFRSWTEPPKAVAGLEHAVRPHRILARMDPEVSGAMIPALVLLGLGLGLLILWTLASAFELGNLYQDLFNWALPSPGIHSAL